MSWHRALHENKQKFYWLEEEEEVHDGAPNGMADLVVRRVAGPYDTEAAMPSAPPRNSLPHGKADQKALAWANQQLWQRLWIML